jgi:hypothetical protein
VTFEVTESFSTSAKLEDEPLPSACAISSSDRGSSLLDISLKEKQSTI